MTSIAATRRQDDLIDLGRLARLPLLFWCLIGVVAVALMDFRTEPRHLITSLGDADDATRIVQVRDLISGASWFDRTLPQLGSPEALVSHWSRIVDAPLVAMLYIASHILPGADAEIAARALWPLVVLFGLLLLFARWADRTAGRGAAIALIGLTVYAQSAMLQFTPGRIDHHNMMILGAVSGILMLTRAFKVPNAGWAAGALLGLGLAIGYEALALTATSLALAALWSAWSGRGLDGVTKAALAFAGVLLVAFLATEPPSAWTRVRCDALSGNLIVLALSGAVGMAAARIRHDASPAYRLSMLAVSGAVGASLYAGMEPACLAGPFGQVDPRLMSVWLSNVQETNSIVRYSADNLPGALQFVVFALTGLGVAVASWHRARDTESLTLLLVGGLAFALACWQIKLMPYATLLAAAPLALAIGRLEPSQGVSAPAKGLLAFFIVNEHTILGAILGVTSLFAVGAAAPPAGHQAAASAAADISRCQETVSIQPLADLPRGLVAADIDLAAFIAALTPHRVVAAPYHRLGKSIIELEAIRSAPADEAAARLHRLGVDYIVTCKGVSTGHLSSSSLAARLQSGAVPDWLEPLDLEGSPRLAVWRVLETASTP